MLYTIGVLYMIGGMWQIYEHKRVPRQLSRIPSKVLQRYQKWKDMVEISGPDGLKRIRGFNDE